MAWLQANAQPTCDLVVQVLHPPPNAGCHLPWATRGQRAEGDWEDP